MTLVIAKPMALRNKWAPMDPDAAAYITAVEAADRTAGQSVGLEEKTKIAIDDFVLGCKADGIWSAIKQSCILAGARTKEGAVVPLVNASGSVPTLNGTSGGWVYDRKTGLQGNGTDNYIDSNRAQNADPQDNAHVSVYVSSLNNGTATFRPFLSNRVDANANPQDGLHDRGTTDNALEISCKGVATTAADARAPRTTGFVGGNRSSSANFNRRSGGITTSVASTSQASLTQTTLILARPGLDFGVARLAFYSIGESLDLAKLDARVVDLINEIGAAF